MDFLIWRLLFWMAVGHSSRALLRVLGKSRHCCLSLLITTSWKKMKVLSLSGSFAHLSAILGYMPELQDLKLVNMTFKCEKLK